MANLNTEQLRRLARLGAIARLEQLKQEESAIRAEFPELFGRGRRGAVAESGKAVGRRRRVELERRRVQGRDGGRRRPLGAGELCERAEAERKEGQPWRVRLREDRSTISATGGA